MVDKEIQPSNGLERRKLSIKNFAGLVTPIPANLPPLNVCIYSIFDGSNKTYYEELYRYIEYFCTVNKYEYIYNECLEAICQYLRESVDRFIEYTGDYFMTMLSAFWKQFCANTRIVENICLPFDRFLLRSQDSGFSDCVIISIGRLCSTLFNREIILHPVLHLKIVTISLNIMQSNRLHEDVPIDVLRDVITMLHFYENHFTKKMLITTEIFYRQQSMEQAKALNILDYLTYATKEIDDENLRIEQLNLRRSRREIMTILIEQLIKGQMDGLLNRQQELYQLFNTENLADLTMLFQLLKYIPEDIKHLVAKFKSYIIAKGNEIMKAKSHFKLMVDSVLRLKLNIDAIVRECFEYQPQFYDAIRIGFTTILNGSDNSTSNSFAKYLSQYVDVQLRLKDTDNIDEMFDSIMVLFRYIQSKDIFQAFYYKHFAKRLLLGKSSSQDAEKSMITKLKQECGDNFTSKLEGMFKDVELSKGINVAFKRSLKDKPINAVDLNIHVLTSSFWPNFPNPKLNLPAQFLGYQDQFFAYYKNAYTKRSLNWQPIFGTCILKGYFAENITKEFHLSMIQAVILLIFNYPPHDSEITVGELLTLTNVPSKELARNLIGLINSNVLIRKPADSTELAKKSKTPEYSDDDLLVLKTDFNDKLYRIKINQGQIKDSREDDLFVERTVASERQFNVDAAIVRIMKRSRMLTHNDLMAQLFECVDCPTTPLDFKKRIEMLIEREYIQRDKDNSEIYLYLA